MMDEEFPAYKLSYELHGLESPLPEEDETDSAEDEDLGKRLSSMAIDKNSDSQEVQREVGTIAREYPKRPDVRAFPRYTSARDGIIASDEMQQKKERSSMDSVKRWVP
jgi:hypothetical protein